MGIVRNPNQLGMGLIGVGQHWESHYRTVLPAFEPRLAIRAVCDPVYSRAAACAREINADVASSLSEMTRRSDIQAWLVVDPDWFGMIPIEKAISASRPALICQSFHYDIEQLEQRLMMSSEGSHVIMPEFPQRFFPSTTRLRELISTQLGPVQRIKIRSQIGPSSLHGMSPLLHENPNSRSEFLNRLDWILCLLGESVESVEVDETGRNEDSVLSIRILIRPETSPQNANPSAIPMSEVVWRIGTSKTSFEMDPSKERNVDCQEIECLYGKATISRFDEISWKKHDEKDLTMEKLSYERSAYSVILDQFCRRALGGLIPAPSMKDFTNCLNLWRRIIRSVEEQTRITRQ